MKQLFIITTVMLCQPVSAQINVFDCSAYTGRLTQAEINAAQDHFGACIVMGEQQSVDISGSDNKNVYAAKQIHLKENFHAGGFSSGGQLHLKIAEQNSIDVAVMNYPDLNSVARYKKFELGVQLPADILTRVDRFLHEEGVHSDELNPFLEWDVDVEATFYHAASGIFKTIDGYYHREYSQNSITHDWDDVGTDYPFRIRYAPPQNGNWIARVSIKVNTQVVYDSEWFGFKVVESGDPGYVYVHPNRKNLMRGDRMIFPVGHNFPGPEEHSIPWGGAGDPSYIGNKLFNAQNTNKATNIEEWNFFLTKVESYFQQGGRYIRTIQSPWSTLIEFEKKGNYYDRLHYAWEQDKLLDLCEQYDALMMFNLQMHTMFEEFAGYGLNVWDWGKIKSLPDPSDPSKLITEYDPNDYFPAYCYNDSIGGLNKMPLEALTNESDLLFHEQRTRYYIARYGYSTKIYEFELLSEPFNLGGNAATSYEPYGMKDTPEQIEVFNAIETYQGRLGWYIKEKMQHTDHLLGVDYTLLLWKKEPEDIRLDQSLHHGTIDIVGANYYAKEFNKYINTKDPVESSNNAYAIKENSTAKAVKEFQAWANKPVILSEFGDGDDSYNCSNHDGVYVDMMSAGFTGVCGYNHWEGKDMNVSFLWPATIRAQQHMNGDDVIHTLSNGNGQWTQGRQQGRNGTNKSHESSFEHQYYVSHNKETVVGYVRNRTFNIMTRGDGTEKCDVSWGYPVNTPSTILWSSPPSAQQLRVEGLKANRDYKIDWYSYKEGVLLPVEGNCRSTSLFSGKFELQHPPLLVFHEPSPLEQPVMWYVIRQYDCQQGMAVTDEETEATLSESDYELLERVSQSDDLEDLPATDENPATVHPNPFENYFVINSTKEDVATLYSIDGIEVGSYSVTKGATKINTSRLAKGVYIVSLQEQGNQFKITKQ